ncbi:MAG: 2-oxoglutarate dehydrogenase complex dihydrolipoyllysine-residue succinyltransferase [Acidobacteriota bacterium]|nr:2-oxoglutarate dehydrogenase complex dihydrolipoyllysine-residue succinyltransferase [Acidobacteriota bacterium]
MPANIVVPEMGESIVDARIAKWLKQEGDQVAVGEPLVELETDKVDVEVAAPQAGVLSSIAHKDGADVKIGDVLGTITEGKGQRAEGKGKDRAEAKGAKGEEPKGDEPKSDEPKAAEPAAEAAPAKAAPAPAAAADVPATPAARRLARQENVDLSTVKSDGPRVTPDDIKSAKAPARTEATEPTRPTPPPSTAPPPPIAPTSKPRTHAPATASRSEERVRMTRRRATIARRLLEAQATAAMLTTFNEVDMTAVQQLRERRKVAFKERYGVSLGLSSFFVKAAVAALREFPRINAEIQGDEMVLKHYYDIGIAVGAEEGLVVPVLRDADRLSFAEIEKGVREFAGRAKDGTLTLDDLRGGTFTITNGGVFGSLMSTPILNPPQVGILGLHAIKDRPAGVDGRIELRPMMYTALTYDHRIVDGSEAVRFLVRIKELVEDPTQMLIEG